MKSQFFVCHVWLLNSFISKVSGYHQLNVLKVRYLLNKYGATNMHTKKYAEWVGFVYTTMLETKSNRMLISLTSNGFFESCNLYNTVRHTQFKFRLGFAFSYGMYSRDSDINEASVDYSGRSRYFYIRLYVRVRSLTPAAILLHIWIQGHIPTLEISVF